MPEIIEVAKFTEELKKFAKGEKIVKIEVLNGRYMAYHVRNKYGEWINKIKNESTGRMVNIKPDTHTGGKYMVTLDGLTDIERELPVVIEDVLSKGKFCYIELSKEWFIGITFGMSGTFKYDYIDNGHCHIKFTLSNGKSFYFYDPRHFGTIIISDDRKILSKKLESLGVDLLKDNSLSLEDFIEKFQQPILSNKNICQVLMGQKIISGIGNYLKAEILYQSSISPFALIGNLTDLDLERLYYAIIDILKDEYSKTRNEEDRFSHDSDLKVYGKDYDPYGNKVLVVSEKDSPDHRTTYYVPKIQIHGK